VVTTQHAYGFVGNRRQPDGPHSVRPIQQSPGDDLRLDFRGVLENIKDAGVAENPRHRKFQRKTVAAVDLHRIALCARSRRRQYPALDHERFLRIQADRKKLIDKGCIGREADALEANATMRGHHV